MNAKKDLTRMRLKHLIAFTPCFICASICGKINPPIENNGPLYAFLQGGYASGINMVVNSPYSHKTQGLTGVVGIGESTPISSNFQYAIEASYGHYGQEKWSGGTGGSASSAKTYQFSHIGWTLLASAEWLSSNHSAFKLKGGVSSMKAEKKATSPDAQSSNRKLIPAVGAGASLQIAAGMRANIDYLHFFWKENHT